MKTEQIPVLRGTILLGVPATGKTFLLQHLALAALRNKPDARLIYIGAPERPDPILALHKGARVIEEGEGLTVIEGERMTAYLCGNGGGALRRAQNVLLETLTAAARPENRNKFIVAVDEMTHLFHEDLVRGGVSNMKGAIFDQLDELLDAPAPTITFLTTFQTVEQIFSLFGERGINLFKRLHEQFVFKGYGDISYFTDCGGVNPRALRPGEAIHIFHGAAMLVDVGLSPAGAVSVKPHELKRVGYWRAREIRGESMAEPLAAALSAGILLLAWLSAVGQFLKHLDLWAARPGFAVLFYGLSVVAAMLSPWSYRQMRAWMTAIIIGATAMRPRGKHLSEDLG